MSIALAAVFLAGACSWFLGPLQPSIFSLWLPCGAFAIFLGGLIAKILFWATSPNPFPITTTTGQQQALAWIPSARLEAPPTLFWATMRLLLEVLFFRSLFRNTRTEKGNGERILHVPALGLWLAALIFHYSLLILILRHLRFFLDPLPGFVSILGEMDSLFQIGAPRLYWTGLLAVAALGYLFLRRIRDAHTRYISLPGDYFFLFLLLGIVCTGIYMRYWDRVDVLAIKEYAMSLSTLRPIPAADMPPVFFTHLCLVSLLLAVAPFSKLTHMVGVFLSPTRALPNNSRQRSWVNPWNPPKEYRTYAEYEKEFHAAMTEAGLPLDAPGMPPGEDVFKAQTSDSGTSPVKDTTA